MLVWFPALISVCYKYICCFLFIVVLVCETKCLCSQRAMVLVLFPILLWQQVCMSDRLSVCDTKCLSAPALVWPGWVQSRPALWQLVAACGKMKPLLACLVPAYHH